MRSLNTRYLLILSLAALVMVVGCSDDDEDASNLEGSWTFSSVAFDGVTQPSADWYETATTVRAVLTFNASGTYTYREYNAASDVTESAGGTYTTAGSSITVTEDGDNDTFTWSITNDTLKLSGTEDGHLLEMFWTRN
jgi:hypothetical protein